MYIQGKKYGDEGPKPSLSKMAYSTVQEVCSCFSMEVYVFTYLFAP